MRITATAGGLVAVVIIALVLGAMRFSAMAKARAWTPIAPPCPTVSQRAYLNSGFPPLRPFDFDQTHVVRSYGLVNCAEIGDDGGRSATQVPVCQFNDPGALAVTVGQSSTYYLPRTSPVTIVISHGRPLCVLGANMGPGGLRN